ncbi:hypothetical protein Syun_012865 [Stephania yunnanensis]|uniref:Uncharacterized protein n=1 Tax=Stephania yunnanensis TaxID=152371 RepID=A0AAP0K1A0_9MAGN
MTLLVPRELAKVWPCSCQGPRQGAAELPPRNVPKELAKAGPCSCQGPRQGVAALLPRNMPKELAKARPYSCQGPRQGATTLPPRNAPRLGLARTKARAKAPLCSTPRRDLFHTHTRCLVYAAYDFPIPMREPA